MPGQVLNTRGGKSLSSQLRPRGRRTGSGQVDTLWLGSSPIVVEYLVIAGGGGGGSGYGSNGGGGAGGYRSSVVGQPSGGGASAETPFEAAGVTYTITVGGGGSAGLQGVNSSITGSNVSITSIGGGAGGHSSYGNANGNGGSGGGNSVSCCWTAQRTQPGGTTATAIAGTAGQGYAGGTWYGAINNGITDEAAAGGGGAGGTGGALAMGRGVKSSITGTLIGRAGGGAPYANYASQYIVGYMTNTTDETGATVDVRTVYGGGNSGGNAVANTGGGARASNSGASGVVILRHSDSFSIAPTTGSPTITVTGGYVIYQFTGSGTITL